MPVRLNLIFASSTNNLGDSHETGLSEPENRVALDSDNYKVSRRKEEKNVLIVL